MDDSKLGYRIPEAAKAMGISEWKLKQEMYQVLSSTSRSARGW